MRKIIQKKQIIIKIEKEKISFEVEGFNNFEVVGLLNYYKDAVVVKMMQEQDKLVKE